MASTYTAILAAIGLVLIVISLTLVYFMIRFFVSIPDRLSDIEYAINNLNETLENYLDD